MEENKGLRRQLRMQTPLDDVSLLTTTDSNSLTPAQVHSWLRKALKDPSSKRSEALTCLSQTYCICSAFGERLREGVEGAASEVAVQVECLLGRSPGVPQKAIEIARHKVRLVEDMSLLEE